MRVVGLVPRRDDNGPRDRLWAHVRERWVTTHPDKPVYAGVHAIEEGPFNRSEAIHRASRQAGDWDVACIFDSDSFVGPEQIAAAVYLADVTGQLVLGYDVFNFLTPEMTEKVMAGYTGWWGDGVLALEGTCSSMVVVPRSLWDEVGGFDPGFVGWGAEDVAFWHACNTIGGGFHRVGGPVWHLHHPSSRENAHTPQWYANFARLERYSECAGDPDAMRALLAELRASVDTTV